MKDLVGQRFGKLVVISLDKVDTVRCSEGWNKNIPYWKCLCDCGNTTSLPSKRLGRKEYTKSCGCINAAAYKVLDVPIPVGKKKFKDLTGLIFGRWKTLKLDHTEVRQTGKQISNVRFWLCQCSCGNQKIVGGPSLVYGHSKSCGCFHMESKSSPETRKKLSKEDTAFRKLLHNYKASAALRGIPWELTDEKFRALTSSPCHYTGNSPSSVIRAKSGEEYVYNGIDRVDNTQGYLPKNCVPCCTEINKMKLDLPLGRFLELCKTVSERYPTCLHPL